MSWQSTLPDKREQLGPPDYCCPKHNPEKADGATKVARRYVGLPHTLNERLVTLYGVGLGPSVPDLVERIEAGRSEPSQTLPRAAGGVELAAAGGVQTQNPASRLKEGKGRV